MSQEPIHHLTTPDAWSTACACGIYEGDTLASEGFIHCSTEDQVLEVANRLFPGREDLIVLVIDPAAVTAEIRYENLEGGSELYPHLYGALPTDAVIDVRELTRDAQGRLRWA